MPPPVFTVEFNADAAIAAMAQYPARVQRATVRALNRALTSGKSRMGSLIAKDMGIKAADAKAAIRVEQATLARLQVRMLASLKRLPLSKFNATGPMPSRGRGRGVSYRIGGRGRGRVENAFLAQMGSSHRGVFKRTGKGRLPIIELFGPSIGRVFDQQRPAVIAEMRQVFDDRLAHELKFASTEGA